MEEDDIIEYDEDSDYPVHERITKEERIQKIKKKKPGFMPKIKKKYIVE